MRLLYALALVLVCCSPTLLAQNYSWEIGGGVQGATYFGDIGGKDFDGKSGPRDFMPEHITPSIGIFARYMFDYRLYFRTQFNFIPIKGSDENSPNTGRTDRNINFTNNVYELYGMAEYHPLIINDLGGKKRYLADLHTYIGVGLGMVYHDPKSVIQNQTVRLRPLNTEGANYSAVSVSVPLSLGAFVSFRGRYARYKVHRIGISVNYSLTFTDYLDDVSSFYPEVSTFGGDETAMYASYQGTKFDISDPENFPTGTIRGNPDKNDGYFTFQIAYSKRILSGKKRHKLPRSQEYYGRTKRRKRG